MDNLEDQSVTLTEKEKLNWAAYVFGKDSLHANIPERKLVINCIYCKRETSNLTEHLEKCEVKNK